jgi:hypothetical protein
MTADKLVSQWVAIARNSAGWLNLTAKQVGYLGALVRETNPATVVRAGRRYHVLSTPYGATITLRDNGTAVLALELA